MNAEILSVGTELLLGNVANTDAQMISEGLSMLGIDVFYHTVVGDNPARVEEAVAIARKRAEIIITTGGLGPTYDDLTKQALADAFGKKLVFDERSADRVRAWFSRSAGRTMTENNLQQAYLPEGAEIFDNDWGTAPGCAFFAGGVHVLMLPGPPRECYAMFTHRALPYLRRLQDAVIFSRSLRIFGQGESAVESRLRARMEEMKNPSLAPYAKEGEVMLRVTAKAATEAEAKALVDPVVSDVAALLGNIVYGTDVNSLEERVFRLLREKGKTLAAAESCTGGLLAEHFTNLPGASGVFLGGVVAYTDPVKEALLGVPHETLERFGAVSRETAEAMAVGARARLGADIALAVTGFAGPDGDEVGRVFAALAAPDGVFCRRLKLGAGRSRIRTMAALHALDMARRYLTGLPVETWAE